MPGLGGADRDAECRRDVGQRHPEVVVHDDDGARLWLEMPESAIEEVAIGDERREVDTGRRVQRREVDFDDASPPTPCDVETGIDQEATEPGVEAIRIAQRGEVSPGSDEAFLDGIMGELGIPKDQASGSVEA